MFLQKGKEGEQYKSQGALAVGSRRYTGELMPSTLCHGGTRDIFTEREKESNRERIAYNLLHKREVFRKTKHKAQFSGKTSGPRVIDSFIFPLYQLWMLPQCAMKSHWQRKRFFTLSTNSHLVQRSRSWEKTWNVNWAFLQDLSWLIKVSPVA